MDILEPVEKESINKAAELLINSKNAVVLTGAGISTESGIPDFRGESGIWAKYKPEIYGSIQAFYDINFI
ncbi:MAG: hypothetical protein E3J52_05690 [Promethearchaeota archaeon]|nr:MAG: hypothetical protein E3J52_05690 [Candidatus Lokiarchaeota archaeon]